MLNFRINFNKLNCLLNYFFFNLKNNYNKKNNILKNKIILILNSNINSTNFFTQVSSKFGYLKLYFNNYNLNNIVLFLRKNKNYIKLKNSKLRPFSKVIVFFGLLLNIIFIYELHLIYYNISMNFGYFITILYVLICYISLKFLHVKIIYNFKILFNILNIVLRPYINRLKNFNLFKNL